MYEISINETKHNVFYPTGNLREDILAPLSNANLVIPDICKKLTNKQLKTDFGRKNRFFNLIFTYNTVIDNDKMDDFPTSQPKLNLQ